MEEYIQKLKSLYEKVKEKNSFISLIDGEENLNTKQLKKFNNAKNSYVNLENDRPLFLFDDTVFGSGKDGFFISNRRFFIHEISSKPKVYTIKDIHSFNYDGKLRCNNEKLNITMINKNDAKIVVEIINLLKELNDNYTISKKSSDIQLNQEQEAEEKETKSCSEGKQPVSNKTEISDKKNIISYISETFMVQPGVFTDADKLVGERLQVKLDKGAQKGYKLHSVLQTAIKNGINLTVTWEVETEMKKEMIYKAKTFMVEPGLFSDADTLVGKRLQPHLDKWAKSGWILHSLVQTAIKNGINITMIWQKEA